MKKREMKLLALALSICLTVSSVNPVAASVGEPVAQTAESTQQGVDMDIQETEGEMAGEDVKEPVVNADETEKDETGSEGTDTEPDENAGSVAPVTDVPEGDNEADPAADAPEKEQPEEAVDTVETEETAGVPAYTTAVALGEAEWSRTSSGRYRLTKISDGKVYGAESKIVRVEYARGKYRYYTFDYNRNMLTGAQTIDGKQYFFTESADSTASPENSAYGSMVISSWVNTSADVWSYYGADGAREAKSGICEIDGKKYYIKDNGAILKSDIVKYEGTYYGFDANGVMITNGTQKWTSNGKLYYFGEDGKQIRNAGWQYLNGSWYKFNNGYSINTAVNGFVSLKFPKDGKKYNFYFKNGIMKKSCWYTKNSEEKYYIDAQGRMVTGIKKIKNAKGVAHSYYFREKKGSKGEPVGTMLKRWVKINKYWYYYSPSKGYRVTGPKVKKIGKKLFAFTQTGKLRKKGFFNVNGKKYFVYRKNSTAKSYVLVNQWIKKSGNYYYAGSDGVITTGWKKIGNYTYYFNTDGVMQKSQTVTYKNGKKVYLDDNGRMVSAGWIKLDGYWRYFSATDGFVKGTSKKIGGFIYYFDSQGRLYQDLRRMFKGRSASQYMLVVNKLTCTVTVLTTDSNGQFIIPVVNFTCSVGTAATPTPNGTFTARSSGRWQMLMGPSWGQYGVNVVGGIFFHSVAGNPQSIYNLWAGDYNLLGRPASHGCIRLCVSDVKWVYENCNGSTVTIHNNSSSSYTYNKIKFEKPAVTPMSYSQNYDPTDPAVPGTKPSVHSNPY